MFQSETHTMFPFDSRVIYQSQINHFFFLKILMSVISVLLFVCFALWDGKELNESTVSLVPERVSSPTGARVIYRQLPAAQQGCWEPYPGPLQEYCAVLLDQLSLWPQLMSYFF